MFVRRASLATVLLLWMVGWAHGQQDTGQARVKDIATVEGVRDNPLLGYGIVIGLNGTGDRRQTLFTTQTLSSTLERLGVQVPPDRMRVNNIAAVIVTATLPPFARPGMRLDVTVSSIGDATNLEGGVLLLTPLYTATGEVYAAAQGALTLGGFTAGGRGNVRQVNHPTVGRIPEGAIVERDASVNLRDLQAISFLLRDPDFATARNMAQAINRDLEAQRARPVDSRRVEVLPGTDTIPELLARLENLAVAVQTHAKVVVNERTGTIVLGNDVRLGAASILHGSLSIEISTQFQVSQPPPLSQTGETVVVPQTTVRAQESPAQRIALGQGATVEDLVRGLQTVGATARDIVAILQALKAVGALRAELEVL